MRQSLDAVSGWVPVRKVLLAIGASVFVAITAFFVASSGNAQPSSAICCILVDDTGFNPQTIYITVGDTVTWEWAGTNPHSVTESSIGWFDSGVHTAPHTFSVTFTQQSPFTQYLQYHSVPDGGVNGPLGYIVIYPPGTPTSTPTPPTWCDGYLPNSDGENRPNGPNVPDDDATWPFADTLGDVCDIDDDNDGIDDVVEAAGSEYCGPAATDPLDVDTDGDHLTDGWECANGSDPNDAQSKALGTGTFDGDQDRVLDVWEARGYAATYYSYIVTDPDGDGCHDLVEIASVDGNSAITIADSLAVARRALNIWPPDLDQDYVLDISKNGTVGIEDRLFVARAAFLPDWVPQSCP